MRFTVVWLEEAEEELARIWYRSKRQYAIASAANAIDMELKIDAHLKGRQKENDRVLIIRPLAVLYHISVDDRLARVLSITEETN
jgi:hypothetical protein